MNKLQKRQYQEYKIKQAIKSLFIIDLHVIRKRGKKTLNRVRRDQTHQQIAQFTKLRYSPSFSGLAKQLLKEAGVISVMCQGYTFYINIKTSNVPDTSILLPEKSKEI